MLALSSMVVDDQKMIIFSVLMIRNYSIGMPSCREDSFDVYQGLDGYQAEEVSGMDSSNCGSWRVEPLGLYTICLSSHGVL